jgi:type VI secretion system protein ImpE
LRAEIEGEESVSKAKALFNEGKLAPAIEELTREVKANPFDAALRIFLFELLSFAGDWNRAERQLDVIGHQNAPAAIGVEAYRNNINAERERHRLFSEGLHPHFLVDPPAYADVLLEAAAHLREGDVIEARRALEQVEKERPRLAGTMNDRPFHDFRDGDDFVAPMLELIVQGKYTWLPFEQVKRLQIATPRHLRDLIWARATIEAVDGTTGEVFLPALYSGSSAHPEDLVKLGRKTDWKLVGEGLPLPLGLRLFLVDDEDEHVFAARSIQFDLSASEERAA